MRTINELTEDQFKHLLDRYFAKPEKRRKMTSDEIRILAKRLNKKIDVPLITETGEEKILIKIIVKIDNFLYDNLPNEFYDLIRSSDNGIDNEEAKRLITSLAKLANDKIDIPYIPEAAEYYAIRFVLAIIINAARKQWNLDKSCERVAEINIPDKESITNKSLNALII